MKKIGATEARNNWFQLLDEVLAGESVVIERKGGRVLLQRQTAPTEAPIPDYSDLIEAGDFDDIANWGWEWDHPDKGMIPRWVETIED